jgi:hypothetical protein
MPEQAFGSLTAEKEALFWSSRDYHECMVTVVRGIHWNPPKWREKSHVSEVLFVMQIPIFAENSQKSNPM